MIFDEVQWIRIVVGQCGQDGVQVQVRIGAMPVEFEQRAVRRGGTEHSAEGVGDQADPGGFVRIDGFRADLEAVPIADLDAHGERDSLRSGCGGVRHTGPVGDSGAVLANGCLSICAPRGGIGL